MSQEKSVPTDRQTLSMHRYVLIESHRKASIALWVHPFSYRLHQNLLRRQSVWLFEQYD